MSDIRLPGEPHCAKHESPRFPCPHCAADNEVLEDRIEAVVEAVCKVAATTTDARVAALRDALHSLVREIRR